jgi:hypothetical protein
MVDRKALICLFVLHACGGRALQGEAPPSTGAGAGGADRASDGHSGNATYPSGSRQANGGSGASTCSPPWVCGSEVWRCSSWYYASGDGCDCNCGAWDPDCDDPAEGVFGCGLGETTCEAPGVCEVGSWSCNQGFYGTRDGCDCNCGAWDPDCDDPTQQVFGCGIGWTCMHPGICGDPDCDDPNQEVFNCAGEEACARPGVCVTDTTSGGASGSGCASSGSNGDECGSDWDCDVRQSCMADASGTHRCKQRRCWLD